MPYKAERPEEAIYGKYFDPGTIMTGDEINNELKATGYEKGFYVYLDDDKGFYGPFDAKEEAAAVDIEEAITDVRERINDGVYERIYKPLTEALGDILEAASPEHKKALKAAYKAVVGSDEEDFPESEYCSNIGCGMLLDVIGQTFHEEIQAEIDAKNAS